MLEISGEMGGEVVVIRWIARVIIVVKAVHLWLGIFLVAIYLFY